MLCYRVAGLAYDFLWVATQCPLLGFRRAGFTVWLQGLPLINYNLLRSRNSDSARRDLSVRNTLQQSALQLQISETPQKPNLKLSMEQ